jgi:nicotinate-nucleotide adenylyltransferase
MPAGVPPHKRYAAEVTDEIRLRLLEAALADDPRFGILDAELRREGPSYTIDTVDMLRAAGFRGDIQLLIGEDQLPGLAAWHESDRLFGEVRFLIAARDDHAGQHRIPSLPATVRAEWLDCPRFSVFSSGIRQLCKEGRPIRYLVPEAVRRIIQEEGLYQ